MSNKTKINIITLFMLLLIGSMPMPVSASAGRSEQPGDLRQLQIGDFISLPVVQQPRGNVTFISALKNDVTEYQSASAFGTTGLMAHNYLAGQYFSQVVQGQEITLVYENLATRRYAVTQIMQYQALSPESPASDFIDLSSGEYLTVSQVFKRTYASHPGRLVLQTCISTEQSPSWGRLFVIADPVDIPSDFE